VVSGVVVVTEAPHVQGVRCRHSPPESTWTSVGVMVSQQPPGGAAAPTPTEGLLRIRGSVAASEAPQMRGV
jgi:hypothetical protein